MSLVIDICGHPVKCETRDDVLLALELANELKNKVRPMSHQNGVHHTRPVGRPPKPRPESEPKSNFVFDLFDGVKILDELGQRPDGLGTADMVRITGRTPEGLGSVMVRLNNAIRKTGFEPDKVIMRDRKKGSRKFLPGPDLQALLERINVR